jgi:hypothetical protein
MTLGVVGELNWSVRRSGMKACRVSLLSAFVAAMLLCTASRADTVFNFDSAEYSGTNATPIAAPPWVRATFTTVGNDVLLTLQDFGLIGGPGFGLTAPESVDHFYFNFLSTVDVSSLTLTRTSGVALQAYSTNSNGLAADGGGKYDIKIDFANGSDSRFGQGSTSTIKISSSAGAINDAMFVDKSVLPADHGQYYAAAHIYDLTAVNGQTSGFIAGALFEGAEIITPLPGVASAGCVLLLGGVSRRLLRRKTA